MGLTFLTGALIAAGSAIIAGGATAAVMSSKHKKQIAALQSKIDRLVRELEEANEERLRLQKELDRVLKEKQRLLAEIARLADEKRSMEERLMQVDAQIKSNSARWRRIVAFLFFRLKNLDAKLRTLEAERQQVEGQVQIMDIQDLRARRSLEEAEALMSRLDPRLKSVLADISEKESEKDAAECELRALCAS